MGGRVFWPRIGKPKAISAGWAHGLSLGDLWRYDLVHFRGSYMAVDFRRCAFAKSDSRSNWRRRYITISFTDREIPITLFGRSGNVDFPFGDAEWDSEPKHYDVV